MERILCSWLVVLAVVCGMAGAQLKPNFYASTCPNVEAIVRKAVQLKMQQTAITVPGTLRLFFHDCMVNGCDASVIIQSTGNNTAEKDNPDNLSLAGDGFDTVIKAKAAVDATPGCTNKVSCADILAIAARDVVNLAGGPSWTVELGRRDGLVSTAASVNGKLPQPSFNLNQLNSMFSKIGLTQNDMVALSEIEMERILCSWLVVLAVVCGMAGAQLKPNFYASTCPNVEAIVRKAVQLKMQQTAITVPGTLRLFFHDCMVNGCDASVIIQSTGNNTAEKDNPDNLSLAGDGFDTVIKAKAAVDATPGCTNKVSCADILAIAARDVVNLAGGPSWTVELGRRDGLVSTAASVNGKLPQPSFNLNQLNSMFSKIGLTQNDMVALSGAHTVGFSHCSKFSNRLYSFSKSSSVDPTLNTQYASQLKQECPKNVDPRIAVSLDPTTPNKFDNVYYKNLMNREGLLTSDQVLFEDSRSNAVVVDWAQNAQHFNQAFTQAMVRLGRVGVKTGNAGNIRIKCDAFN